LAGIEIEDENHLRLPDRGLSWETLTLRKPKTLFPVTQGEADRASRPKRIEGTQLAVAGLRSNAYYKANGRETSSKRGKIERGHH